MNVEFPKMLFVHEPLPGDAIFEAYPTWSDAEEDDTVAVYELKEVCRVRVKRRKTLVLESDLTRTYLFEEAEDGK